MFDWQLRSDQADLDPVTFGRSRVAGYGVLDTVLEWQVIPALNLQLKVGNVLDKTYEVVDGYATLGRHAMLSARHAF
jgi:vitamin B12 transporter